MLISARLMKMILRELLTNLDIYMRVLLQAEECRLHKPHTQKPLDKSRRKHDQLLLMWVTNLLSSLQVQRKMIVNPEFPKNTSTAWLAAGH